MPGFYVGNMGSTKLDNYYNDTCIYSHQNVSNYFVARNTLNKFLNDKCFFNGEDYFVIAEGVLTNKRKLFAKYSSSTIPELIISSYIKHGDKFFNEFRGSFSGAIYDIKSDKWIIYTNHNGDNSLFYYTNDLGQFCIGSQVNYILDTLNNNDIEISIDEKAIISMITYAYMYDDFTYAKEIKRLKPGHYVSIEKGIIKVDAYYRIKDDLYDLSDKSENEIIHELDNLFRDAVEDAFLIDSEYGLKHLSDLSGGLDSRMVNWVAHDLGFTDTVNICYSQCGYLDEIIATEISTVLGNEMLFKPQNSARFLFKPERIINMNYGLGLYSGITSGEELLHEINIPFFGVEHTGQLGDVVLGCFLKSSKDKSEQHHAGMYSKRLMHLLPDLLKNQYADQEERLLFIRGFLGCQSSHFLRRNYTEVLSPFTNVDFMRYCLSISIDKRAKHNIYKSWIKSKYPMAGKFKWEKEGTNLFASKIERILKKLSWGFQVALSDYMLKGKYHRKNDMNPFEYWTANLPELNVFLNDRFTLYFKQLPQMGEINAYIKQLFKEGTTIEKTMALTAVMACRYYIRYGKNWEIVS